MKNKSNDSHINLNLNWEKLIPWRNLENNALSSIATKFYMMTFAYRSKVKQPVRVGCLSIVLSPLGTQFIPPSSLNGCIMIALYDTRVYNT